MPRSWLLLPPLLLLSVLGCPAEPHAPSTLVTGQGSARKLTVLATGDVGSDTDVCGCKAHPMGGIARRAKVVKERSGARAVVVDAGDLFFRQWSISPRYHAQSIATAEFLADAAKQMSLAAIAVGERDLALGIPELKRLGERGGLRVLSANLVYASTSSAPFDAFAVVERGGMKIGIVGVSPEMGAKAQAEVVYEQNRVTTKPLFEAVDTAARAARSAGGEVVIALLHLGQQPALELLGKLEPGVVDVAIVSHDRLSGNLTLAPGGRSAWIAPGSRGKWLAAVDLEVVKDAHGLLDVGALESQREAIAAIDQRLEAYQNEDAGVVDPGIAEKIAADRSATVQRLKSRRAKMQEELDHLSLAGKNRVSGELIGLDVALPDDPEMLALYQQYQDRLIRVNSGEPPPDRAELRYAGSAACKRCHAPMYQQWEKTKHAKAWDTMVRTRQTGNLDCIPCHVTGFDRRGGPTSLLGLESFVNVGCESCHGPGSAHVAQPKVKLDYGAQVPERVCAECHRAQEDQRPFDYEARLPTVRHAEPEPGRPRLGR